jgi:branched-chain amino acid transport system permease protein
VRLYEGASHLDQVLFSIGLVFASMALADYVMGSPPQVVHMPAVLTGQVRLLPGVEVGAYRLFLIAACGVTALVLHFTLIRTRFGCRLRAAVDNARVARGLGIDVNRVFAITFAAGSALAGLGGALGVDILTLDPTFPIRYMVYFLIVVAVGGSGTVTGPLLAALVLGVCDAMGKYYLPQIGAFIIYAVMIAVLLLRPQGLFGRPAAR